MRIKLILKENLVKPKRLLLQDHLGRVYAEYSSVKDFLNRLPVNFVVYSNNKNNKKWEFDEDGKYSEKNLGEIISQNAFFQSIINEDEYVWVRIRIKKQPKKEKAPEVEEDYTIEGDGNTGDLPPMLNNFTYRKEVQDKWENPLRAYDYFIFLLSYDRNSSYVDLNESKKINKI